MVEQHDLVPPIAKLLEGIEEFNEVANNRVVSGQFSIGHMGELNLARKTLLDLQLTLLNLLE